MIVSTSYKREYKDTHSDPDTKQRKPPFEVEYDGINCVVSPGVALRSGGMLSFYVLTIEVSEHLMKQYNPASSGVLVNGKYLSLIKLVLLQAQFP